MNAFMSQINDVWCKLMHPARRGGVWITELEHCWRGSCAGFPRRNLSLDLRRQIFDGLPD